jgi:serine/threonine protein phosphatase 1
MPRRRLNFEHWPAAVYAVGDVHGCLPELIDLELEIMTDAAAVVGEKWIVMLGDYVDRGEFSAQVVEHLVQPPPAGFKRYCLMGNHEQMMLDFLTDPVTHGYWLEEGGAATLRSYGADSFAAGRPGRHLAEIIPGAHLQFLRDLPISLSLPGWLFVHAGIRPGLPLSEQTDEDLIWIREPFLNSPLPPEFRVVHGHTPGPEPIVTRHRICVDTQCFLSGQLTAVRITPDGDAIFLSASA